MDERQKPNRYAAGAVSSHGLAVARSRLLAQMLDLLSTTRSAIPAVRRPSDCRSVGPVHLLGDPAIDATNWRAELRFAQPS